MSPEEISSLIEASLTQNHPDRSALIIMILVVMLVVGMLWAALRKIVSGYENRLSETEKGDKKRDEILGNMNVTLGKLNDTMIDMKSELKAKRGTLHEVQTEVARQKVRIENIESNRKETTDFRDRQASEVEHRLSTLEKSQAAIESKCQQQHKNGENK